jgi:hypothetical protein
MDERNNMVLRKGIACDVLRHDTGGKGGIRTLEGALHPLPA